MEAEDIKNEELNDQTEEQTQAVEPQQAHETFQEKFIKLSADLENYKRRVSRERAEWMDMAQVHLLVALLPIFDELDRALALASAAQTDSTNNAWLDGLKLIQKNWQKKLEEIHVKVIDATGIFNPELHEALMQVEDPEKESGQIVQVFHKGYTFKDKAIVHAKVSVAK
ncbi:nucleotide exchange factor GrpE [Candidatus Babeliales bacterium]|nr:nucleotide exchange factor GrpE [Candidatus Babeliales bacterium]